MAAEETMASSSTTTHGKKLSNRVFTREEVGKHTSAESRLLIINKKVYDFTEFAKRHPGGARIICHFAGQDATDTWVAFHDRKELVKKYLNPLLVGEVKDTNEDEVVTDFRELRSLAENMGLFRTNPLFYIGHMLSIFLCVGLGYWILKADTSSWLNYSAAIVLLTIAQAQAGWTQHDYGHLSVFESNRANHFAHQIITGVIKGASSHWWNFRHFQHHAKPNVIQKDPDVNIAYLFLLGEKVPVEWGQKKRGFMPYNWQQDYFFLFGPPFLLPVYFHLEVVWFVFKRKDWLDLSTIVGFFTWWFALFGPVLGGWSAFWFYMTVRFFESHWFVWCTQMSHIPMKVDRDGPADKREDWFSLQLATTANADQSFFNDWFTGHLNFQIEHHLFPTMPRHNFHRIQPYVKSMCKKHNIHYQCAPLLETFANLVRSLKKSGELWYDAYHG